MSLSNRRGGSTWAGPTAPSIRAAATGKARLYWASSVLARRLAGQAGGGLEGAHFDRGQVGRFEVVILHQLEAAGHGGLGPAAGRIGFEIKVQDFILPAPAPSAIPFAGRFAEERLDPGKAALAMRHRHAGPVMLPQPRESLPMQGTSMPFIIGAMGAWYSAVPSASRRCSRSRPSRRPAAGGRADGPPAPGGVVGGVDGMADEAGADADFIADDDRRQKIGAGAAASSSPGPPAAPAGTPRRDGP